MKLLVIGSEGSIGKKRKQILEEMGHKVTGIDIKTRTQWDPDMAEKFDAAFICVPPQQAVIHASGCIDGDLPFFLEKPGAVNHRDFLTLTAKLQRKDIVNMVSCNLRFTEEFKAIRNALPNIGKPVFAYAEFGYYLPFWREGQYSNYYSCWRVAGGGIMMDAIHELDYMFNLFGHPDKPKAIIVTNENTKELPELDAEDSANVIVLYKTGLTMTIHLDYLQRAYSRRFHVIGTKGRIDQTFNVQGNYAMYRNEMQHFLDCVKNDTPTIKTVEQHLKLLEFIDKSRDPENHV